MRLGRGGGRWGWDSRLPPTRALHGVFECMVVSSCVCVCVCVFAESDTRSTCNWQLFSASIPAAN